jgi:hypothetical protein
MIGWTEDIKMKQTINPSMEMMYTKQEKEIGYRRLAAA